MKILHIMKTKPDELTTRLLNILSEGEETRVFPLYEADPDYEALLDLIFEYDKTISWW
jgi:hypothetical protein